MIYETVSRPFYRLPQFVKVAGARDCLRVRNKHICIYVPSRVCIYDPRSLALFLALSLASLWPEDVSHSV